MLRVEQLQQQFSEHYVDLASERLGGETLACSDDFFAEMENLIKPGRGIFIDDKYTERGKWMDGWESRRSFGRNNGREFDWCIIKLGAQGKINGVDIDTNHFRGNAPLEVSIEACNSALQPDQQTAWQTILPKTAVQAHSQNLFAIDSKLTQAEQVYTHVRLNIFPDGGVARLRIYGEVVLNWHEFVANELIDLAAIKNGAKALLVSDMFFSDKNNLLMPGRGKTMGDGWETKRRRDSGHDWSIVQLAQPGNIQKVVIDTHHFKGNFPDSFSLQGACLTHKNSLDDSVHWQTIIGQTKLFAHREHIFVEQIEVPNEQYFTHVRLNIFPDGGVSRMRIYGQCQTLHNIGQES